VTLAAARRLRKAYATGRYTQRELAARYGIKLWTARRVIIGELLPDPGYTYHRPRRRKPDAKLAGLLTDIRRLRAAGHTLAAIAKLVGATRQAVHQRLHDTP